MGSTETSANVHDMGGGEAFLEATPASSGYSFIDQAMRRLDHPDEPDACYGTYDTPLYGWGVTTVIIFLPRFYAVVNITALALALSLPTPTNCYLDATSTFAA